MREPRIEAHIAACDVSRVVERMSTLIYTTSCHFLFHFLFQVYDVADAERGEDRVAVLIRIPYGSNKSGVRVIMPLEAGGEGALIEDSKATDIENNH